MSILSLRLKRAREKRGLKQVDVYKKTGINNKTLSGYENAISEPDIETLKVLAELYNVTLDYLTGNEGKETKEKPALKDEMNDAETTIRLIEEQAAKLGLSPNDPVFKKMLSDAFELLRLARGKDS